MNNNVPILELKNVYRSFKQGAQTLQVLRGVNLDIEKGEVIALVGQSGSGKSTLLNVISSIDIFCSIYNFLNS